VLYCIHKYYFLGKEEILMPAKKYFVYPNLEAELRRFGLKPSDLCGLLGLTVSNVYTRIAGLKPFTFDETQAIRTYLELKSGEHFDLDYLFERSYKGDIK
jgi:hypothetical protein